MHICVEVTAVAHAFKPWRSPAASPTPAMRAAGAEAHARARLLLTVLYLERFASPAHRVDSSPSQCQQVQRVLATCDEWQFDAFRLADVTQGHPLSALAFYLIHRQGLIVSLKLDAVALARCAASI